MRKVFYQQGLTAEVVEQQQRVSSSFLKEAKRSMAHAWARYIDPDRPLEVSTEAQRLGTALHMATLEQADFPNRYAVRLTPEAVPAELRSGLVLASDDLRALIDKYNASKPIKLSTTGTLAELRDRIERAGTNLDPSTLEVMKGSDLKTEIEHMNKTRIESLSKSGTNGELRDRLVAAGVQVVLFSDLVEKQRLEAQYNGVTLISDAEMELCQKISRRVRNKPISRVVFDHPEGEYEVELAWRCDVTGIILRCRADYIIKPCRDYPNGLVMDPKFVENADHDPFKAAVRRWSWEIQAAFNSRGLQAVFGTEQRPDFLWLAAEKESPFASAYYYATLDQFRLGDFWVDTLVPKVAECLTTGIWPDYSDEALPLEPYYSDLKQLELVE